MTRLQALLPLLFLCVGTFEARSHQQQQYNHHHQPLHHHLNHHHQHHQHHHSQQQHHPNVQEHENRTAHNDHARGNNNENNLREESTTNNNATPRSLRLTLIDSKPGSEFDDLYYDRNTNKYHRHHIKPTQPNLKTEVFHAPQLPQSHYHRRHLCPQHKTVQTPVKTIELYNRSVFKHYSEPCRNHQMCTGVRIVHEPAYRDVIRQRTSKQTVYNCCPGWERDPTKSTQGCPKPICQTPCKNGGVCTKPDVCQCKAGFTGKNCESDINECKNKPCDQMCFNTEGSYYCQCREGFVLHSDRESCIMVNTKTTALEADEMDNEVDYEEINSRLDKLENTLESDKAITNEISQKLQKTTQTMSALQKRIDGLENRQQDIGYLRERIKSYDHQTRKMEHTVQQLYRCRMNPIFCP